MVEVLALSKLPEVIGFIPRRLEDTRGHFMETFRQTWLTEVGIDVQFYQDNQSFSAVKGTLRGLHFQDPPYAQGKLVRCVRGRIWDVAVDIRPTSATFGVWDGLELSEVNGEQLYIPPGFAHGFLTLEDQCVLAYKCTAYYEKSAEGAIHYADPDLAIDWPEKSGKFLLSDKDSQAMSFQEYKDNRNV